MREVEWSGRMLRVRAFGRISPEALLDAARSITADSRYEGIQFLVTDFLDVTWSEAALLAVVEDLMVILLGASALNPNIRFVVIAQDPYIVELADALTRFNEEELLPIRVFGEREQALAWVEVQPWRSRPSVRFRPR